MKDLKYEYDLAVLVLGLNLIGGKWAVQILWYLSKGSQRFSELYEHFRYTSRSVFTKQLHDLESAGLIKRTVHSEAPVRVSIPDRYRCQTNSRPRCLIEWSREYVKTQKEEGMSDIDFLQQSFLSDKYRGL